MKQEIIFENNRTIIKNLKNFIPEQVFECGQCFRFDKTGENRYRGVAMGKYIEVVSDGKDVIIENCTESDYENIFKDFFHMSFDYSTLSDKLPCDETLKNAIQYSSGIRILAQDPWETLCSFIISQNNNIPRIKGIIKNLCQSYGDKIYTDTDGIDHYSFPDAETISSAGITAMQELRTGFRAKYIIDAANKVTNGEIDLAAPFDMSYVEGTEYLTQIKGVGNKVASCVLLFAYKKYDAFPVDVWVKRILEKYYDTNTDGAYFGEYAGIAQQYLFYYERCQNNVFLNKGDKDVHTK